MMRKLTRSLVFRNVRRYFADAIDHKYIEKELKEDINPFNVYYQILNDRYNEEVDYFTLKFPEGSLKKIFEWFFKKLKNKRRFRHS